MKRSLIVQLPHLENSGEGFYYSKLDDNERPTYIYYHKLGSDPEKDELIHHEKDPRFFIGVEILKTQKIYLSLFMVIICQRYSIQTLTLMITPI